MDDDGAPNPWSVENLEEFLYFCCPECDEKNQNKELFIKHALDQHPKSKKCLPKMLVKEEITTEEENISTNDLSTFDNLPSRCELSLLQINFMIYRVSKENANFSL